MKSGCLLPMNGEIYPPTTNARRLSGATDIVRRTVLLLVRYCQVGPTFFIEGADWSSPAQVAPI